jgi:hypothetical protein
MPYIRPTVGTMSVHTSPDDELPAKLVRVRDAVACELDAQLGLRGETIILSDVCEVAFAVAVRLGQEFQISYAPQDRLQDDDFLSLDGAVFYGSVMPPENDHGMPDRYPLFDYR